MESKFFSIYEQYHKGFIQPEFATFKFNKMVQLHMEIEPLLYAFNTNDPTFNDKKLQYLKQIRDIQEPLKCRIAFLTGNPNDPFDMYYTHLYVKDEHDQLEYLRVDVKCQERLMESCNVSLKVVEELDKIESITSVSELYTIVNNGIHRIITPVYGLLGELGLITKIIKYCGTTEPPQELIENLSRIPVTQRHIDVLLAAYQTDLNMIKLFTFFVNHLEK